ncbi:MAG: hypothetical protein IFJ97_01575 [Acidobacteria bacterium]|uniref:Uncharacterized protein n=1 Tax=Candidatus Sulfomarinibacter kjeldsenii TaxID=2885994 RepID=A0A8J7CEA1_9BACT|nr:hypothetical protein [Candidatus Sulfomarinibacter kjeldsenii]
MSALVEGSGLDAVSTSTVSSGGRSPLCGQRAVTVGRGRVRAVAICDHSGASPHDQGIPAVILALR